MRWYIYLYIGPSSLLDLAVRKGCQKQNRLTIHNKLTRSLSALSPMLFT